MTTEPPELIAGLMAAAERAAERVRAKETARRELLATARSAGVDALSRVMGASPDAEPGESTNAPQGDAPEPAEPPTDPPLKPWLGDEDD